MGVDQKIKSAHTVLKEKYNTVDHVRNILNHQK